MSLILVQPQGWDHIVWNAVGTFIQELQISVIELKISEILLEISIIELQISVMRITDICNSPKYELLPSTVPRIKMVGPHAIDSMLFSLI